MNNFDLLCLEMATLWGEDLYGRTRPHPAAAIVCIGSSVCFRFGPDVLLSGNMDLLAPKHECDSDPHPVIQGCRDFLAPIGELRLITGLSHIFDFNVLPPIASDLEIFTSSEPTPRKLKDGRPQGWWEPDEWDHLVSGELGVWAIGMRKSVVVSICHTPVCNSEAAEAGVWTHPEYRHLGYGTAVCQTWAQVARTQFKTLFYSTTSANGASRSLAKTLSVRPIGGILELQKVD